MNGLTLRINKGGGKKSKNTSGFAPLVIPGYTIENQSSKKDQFDKFLHSTSAEEQLSILKNIVEGINCKEVCDIDTIQFLTVVFFNAKPKHPLKCFLTRYVSKNNYIQQSFSIKLSELLLQTISPIHAHYIQYVNVVWKILSCTENFLSGCDAVRAVEVDIAVYLKRCLQCCIDFLKNSTLSPTEKNEIFNLAHLSLRMTLYIVQKVTKQNISNLVRLFEDLRMSSNYLLFDYDVPMDTKSVCGIMYLYMEVLEYGPNSWINILKPEHYDDRLMRLLSIEASQLSLHSAIATVQPLDILEKQLIEGTPSVLVLSDKILAIGERSSSESTFILGVTRTLLQLSKGLEKITDIAIGLDLVDKLLTFVWSHLEHYMDSVRHLTAQMLNCVVKYCTKLRREGDVTALNKLLEALSSLEKTRKSYYLSLSALASELGAVELLTLVPTLIGDVIGVLYVQPVQASATTTLEILIQKHIGQTSTQTAYDTWILPIMSYVAICTLDTGVLNILESLLAMAVKLNNDVMDYILPHITSQTYDLKCTLMILSVIRKSGVTNKLPTDLNEHIWKGIISYEVLKEAAVDSVEETRILSLSLVVESPKTTEVFLKGELQVVLHFLKYNINEQSPNFRQLILSMMKKFIKRLEDSYKVFKKQLLNDDYYLNFVEDLRAQCFDNLIPRANYSRRFISLQVLLWCENINLDGYQRIWKEEFVEKLLSHLEDSYENNKIYSLSILEKCPGEMLKDKTYSMSLDLADILRQASSLKPTDCVSAAYKLELLKNKLPDYILLGNTPYISDPVSFTLFKRLHDTLRAELLVCQQSIVNGAVHAPMYGLLHCMVHLVTKIDVNIISRDENWTCLVRDVITTCIDVNAAVACVVNNSSPEGHLPMDMGGVAVSDYGNSGGVQLQNGRQVTAQMVLLCAWRSVKEVSLLLGEISSCLTIQGEDIHGTLSPDQLIAIGEHFTSLLAETKHRGAFEQAYVGFTKLLDRLWRCHSASLHGRPREWLSALTAALRSPSRTLSSTRRSAGLPFMIQALVTTELQVQGNGKCFHECMSSLLHLASTAPSTDDDIETRAHSINILRALFRNAALDESVAPYVGEGLMVALRGFEGGTWMERNSSTLLFSALMVRVFGVQRSRDSDNLCVRNRMTGRIFFLRYPSLYDFMLEKLKEVSASDDTQILQPSLYPILLLLARLYPSSLEGTVSNLKLVSFVPHVLACARSGVLKTRQLAAKAMVPLISPELYVPHIECMLDLISDQTIKRNYCHGILLQLIRLLDAKPDNLIIDGEATKRSQEKIKSTLWILEQVTHITPCYLLADEYVKVINLFILRFPCIIQQNICQNISRHLEKALFTNQEVQFNSGKDIFLSNALSLYLIILNKYDTVESICELVYKTLAHDSYEVVISCLNYLLILNASNETVNKFHEHLSFISKKDVLICLRRNHRYVTSLCQVLKSNKYLECTQKTLRALTLENDTEKYVIQMKVPENIRITDDIIIKTLISCIENEHENLTHIYLDSLSKLVTKKLKNTSINACKMLEVIRVIFAYSSSDNSDITRSVVVRFLERNFTELYNFDLVGLSEGEKFEYKSTLVATIVTVLEDDDPTLRQRTSNAITKLTRSPKVIPSRASEILSEFIVTYGGKDAVVLFTLLALLDFKSEVCISDAISDECRVFDQNERYNIFLEETVWSIECAYKILSLTKETIDVQEYLKQVIHNPMYVETLTKLCNNNLVLFESTVTNSSKINNDAINPKIKTFIDVLIKNKCR